MSKTQLLKDDVKHARDVYSKAAAKECPEECKKWQEAKKYSEICKPEEKLYAIKYVEICFDHYNKIAQIRCPTEYEILRDLNRQQSEL